MLGNDEGTSIPILFGKLDLLFLRKVGAPFQLCILCVHGTQTFQPRSEMTELNCPS